MTRRQLLEILRAAEAQPAPPPSKEAALIGDLLAALEEIRTGCHWPSSHELGRSREDIRRIAEDAICIAAEAGFDIDAGRED